jgi:hypothetical protein
METNKIWALLRFADMRLGEREQRVFCQRLYIPHVNFVFSMKPVGRAAENELVVVERRMPLLLNLGAGKTHTHALCLAGNKGRSDIEHRRARARLS